MTEPTPDELASAASLLGRRGGSRQTQAQREALAKLHDSRPEGAPCNCNTNPHRWDCPVYKRAAVERSRQKRKDKSSEQI